MQDRYRTIDGSGNNLENPDWGKAETALLRNTTPAYEGLNGPSGSDRPRAKLVSDVVCVQSGKRPNEKGLSDYMWAWGQFLDHELDLSPDDSGERFDIPAGRKRIRFVRSRFDPESGTGIGRPRQQLNVLSAFVDAANVYGTDPGRAAVLRSYDGSGTLRLEKKGLLPKNPGGLPNAPSSSTAFFIAGDIRANEHVVLTCLHTLFVREHNRIAKELWKDRRFAKASDEDLYQHARKIVGGLMQAITYNEFLPALLGENARTPYRGYCQHVNPGICNVFSTAAYRLGHSMLSPEVRLVRPNGTSAGSVPFRDLFFNPTVVEKRGIGVFLAGLATQRMQEVDTRAVDDVRGFLFHQLQDSPMDLAALNIQRGRDHGLPDYNRCRVDYGLAPKETFEEITSDPETCSRLEKAYGTVDRIDPWIGGLAEDHHPGAVVGEFFFHVLKDQFERVRGGDRFWYAQDLALSDRERREIDRTTLSKVIRRNTRISKLSRNVFRV